MLQRVMVPTDGSAESEWALPYAQAIATSQSAEVLLVQAVQMPIGVSDEYDGGGMVWQEAYETLENLAQANLDALTERLRAVGAAVQSARILGHPALALLDFERERKPDLVVMASHGRMGVARFALGSVADRIVRHGTAPVLLVRNESADARLSTAFVMLDGSGLAEESLKAVKLLAGHPLHKVVLFRAVADSANRRPAATYLEGVAAQLAKQDLEAEVLTDVGDPSILFEKAASGSDFIVLSTHGRGGIDRFRHGSVAERVVHASTKPVLLVRAGLLPE